MRARKTIRECGIPRSSAATPENPGGSPFFPGVGGPFAAHSQLSITTTKLNFQSFVVPLVSMESFVLVFLSLQGGLAGVKPKVSSCQCGFGVWEGCSDVRVSPRDPHCPQCLPYRPWSYRLRGSSRGLRSG